MGPDYPALTSAGLSAPKLLQRLDLREGYKYPLLPQTKVAHFLLKSPPLEPLQETQDSLDLLLQPSKALDLWRIEGEDPDLHLHRSDLHFPLICLRAPLLVFHLETLVACG